MTSENSENKAERPVSNNELEHSQFEKGAQMISNVPPKGTPVPEALLKPAVPADSSEAEGA